MLSHLPRRHRTLLAVGLAGVAVVVGVWVSTLVGEHAPALWGLALGAAAGVVLAVAVLRAAEHGGAVGVTRSRGGPPGLR